MIQKSWLAMKVTLSGAQFARGPKTIVAYKRAIARAGMHDPPRVVGMRLTRRPWHAKLALMLESSDELTIAAMTEAQAASTSSFSK